MNWMIYIYIYRSPSKKVFAYKFRGEKLPFLLVYENENETGIQAKEKSKCEALNQISNICMLCLRRKIRIYCYSPPSSGTLSCMEKFAFLYSATWQKTAEYQSES